jgi:hypothetical protein
MNLSGIVTQLQTVTGLSGNVVIGLPAQIEGIASGPYAWITDVLETSQPSGRVNQPSIQRISTRVAVTFGAQDFEDVLTVRDAARLALIDYQPDAPGDPLQYRQGRLEFLDGGWTYWRDEYEFAYYIDMLEQP